VAWKFGRARPLLCCVSLWLTTMNDTVLPGAAVEVQYSIFNFGITATNKWVARLEISKTVLFFYPRAQWARTCRAGVDTLHCLMIKARVLARVQA